MFVCLFVKFFLFQQDNTPLLLPVGNNAPTSPKVFQIADCALDEEDSPVGRDTAPLELPFRGGKPPAGMPAPICKSCSEDTETSLTPADMTVEVRRE